MASPRCGVTGLISGGLGSIASKLMSKLNLCGKMSNLAKKAMCPTVDAMIGVASGMAGSAAADALIPNNCFVAGTPVCVLKEGVDADAANEALAEGASWEDFAEQKPIEEVEAGDYALSRPEDNADGQLRFMPVTETYSNPGGAGVEALGLLEQR